MYDTTFDAERAELPRRDRRALWMLRIAAITAVIVSASLEAQMPGAPVLQNAWATPNVVGAVNIGGGSDGTVYAAAGAWTPGGGRFQLSGGLGFETRTGRNSRAAYGARVAIPLGGASSSFGFAAFAGIGGGAGAKKSTAPAPGGTLFSDTTASSLQIPVGASVGWRKAIGTSHGVSVYASPYYEFFNSASWTAGTLVGPGGITTIPAGSKTGGVVRVGLGADFGITPSLGATVGVDFGGTRARAFGGPSGSLYGLGVSYAFGRR